MNEIVFFSSSRIKQNHLKYLARNYNIEIVSYREKTYNANYEEPRIDDREKLLSESFKSALNQFEKSNLLSTPFFIEDTSVVIYGLSTPEKEVPGVDIKYWMKDTRFEDLDLQLSMLGNNRKTTVRSDILAYIPNAPNNPYRFTSQTDGEICKIEESFDTNPIYPWLDNKTFNKWFVPKGADHVLSKLPIEKADKFDFRRPAFEEMMKVFTDFGYHYKVNINQPLQKKSHLTLPKDDICHIVVGLSCSGKTTIAEYLSNEYNFFHIEASDFMHLLYRAKHGVNSEVDIGKFAVEILNDTPSIITSEIIKYLESYDWPRVIITGFRKNEEVETFLKDYAISSDIKIFEISANLETRLKRKEIRKRNKKLEREKLVDRDKRELDMGISRIVKRADCTKITNEGTFESFFENYIANCDLDSPISNSKPNLEPLLRKEPLHELIILALYFSKSYGEKGGFHTTNEICKLINNEFSLSKPKNKNNVSRYFNQKNRVFYDVISSSGKNKYRLSNTGVGMAKRILNYNPSP